MSRYAMVKKSVMSGAVVFVLVFVLFCCIKEKPILNGDYKVILQSALMGGVGVAVVVAGVIHTWRNSKDDWEEIEAVAGQTIVPNDVIFESIGYTLQPMDPRLKYLKELFALKNSGVISEGEFNMKKWDILSRD